LEREFKGKKLNVLNQKMLWELGADFNSKDDKGRPPLFLVATQEDYVVKKSKEKGEIGLKLSIILSVEISKLVEEYLAFPGIELHCR